MKTLGLLSAILLASACNIPPSLSVLSEISLRFRSLPNGFDTPDGIAQKIVFPRLPALARLERRNWTVERNSRYVIFERTKFPDKWLRLDQNTDGWKVGFSTLSACEMFELLDLLFKNPTQVGDICQISNLDTLVDSMEREANRCFQDTIPLWEQVISAIVRLGNMSQAIEIVKISNHNGCGAPIDLTAPGYVSIREYLDEDDPEHSLLIGMLLPPPQRNTFVSESVLRLEHQVRHESVATFQKLRLVYAECMRVLVPFWKRMVLEFYRNSHHAIAYGDFLSEHHHHCDFGHFNMPGFVPLLPYVISLQRPAQIVTLIHDKKLALVASHTNFTTQDMIRAVEEDLAQGMALDGVFTSV